MSEITTRAGAFIAQAICSFLPESDAASIQSALILETPPSPDMGDIGVPMFPFAKTLRMAPPAIASKISAFLAQKPDASAFGEFFAVGPYVNVRLKKAPASFAILNRVNIQKENYGSLNDDSVPFFAGRRIMVEFSAPNTNKPLHLGHLRNDALGESVSRILKSAGASVYKVNMINNRGVHICKTMLAYQKFHAENGDTPESLGVKSDRFVGDCYVQFNDYAKNNPDAETQAQNLLIEWEKDNADVRELWQKMNNWALKGIFETYKRTGISFDKLYYESDTYLKGKEEVLKGLEQKIFYREDDGSVWVDLADIKLDKKVLLRKDGTALYMTQDLGTAIFRHRDWEFDQMVYVVGSEQQYHFKVLFYILQKLGYPWAKNLFHLSYGMVNLPEGKMKSREGTVVDADDLLNGLKELAHLEIKEKGREEAVGDASSVSESIALGALHYFLLQQTPVKDMLFNPKESLAFNGNTGPYLQYMGARICSILKKAAESGVSADYSEQAASLLSSDDEWALIKLLDAFPEATLKAAEKLDPSFIASYVYEVAKAFGKFYHECPIVGAGTTALSSARLNLALCTLVVLKKAMNLILVPFLEVM